MDAAELGFGIPQRELKDPEPDPSKRRYLFRVDIASGEKHLFRPAAPAMPAARPRKPRVNRLHEEIRALVQQGITDPWEIGPRVNVGYSAVMRHLEQIYRKGV